MNSTGPWTNADYELMSWHDVHVYGFRLENFTDENGSADLVLDIDYILKWEEAKAENTFLFTVCRAELRFHDVFGLKFSIDYSSPQAGMCPFSIDGIVRDVKTFPTGYQTFKWRLPINWPKGSIEFDAPAFTQTLVGTPQVQLGHQALSTRDRGDGIAA